VLSRHTLITSLDIGTSSTKAVIAEVDSHGYVELLGHGLSPTNGFKDDVVSDIRALGETIIASVEMAEEMAAQRASSLVVAIGGEHVRIMQSQGGVSLHRSGSSSSGRYINRQDLKKAIDSAAAIPVSMALQILHVLPINYYVDGQKVKNPEGLSGSHLDVDVMIIAARQTVLNSIAKAAEYADCRISKFCYRPLATGKAVMSGQEMDQGTCLIDVGGRHTDVAVFKEGRMVFTSTLALGGENITLDTCSNLDVVRSEGEKIKLNYGHCTSLLAEDVEFQVTGLSDGALWRTIKKSELGNNVIRPRAEEIIEESLLAVNGFGKGEGGVCGAVLTGGASQLPGFIGLASVILPFQVNIGVNSGFENMDEVSSRPDHSTALGLVLFDIEGRMKRREEVMDNPLSRLCSKFLRKIHSVM
jgi:cell division protein FtsA